MAMLRSDETVKRWFQREVIATLSCVLASGVTVISPSLCGLDTGLSAMMQHNPGAA